MTPAPLSRQHQCPRCERHAGKPRPAQPQRGVQPPVDHLRRWVGKRKAVSDQPRERRIKKFRDQRAASNKKFKDQLAASNEKFRDQLAASNKKFKDAVKSATDRRADGWRMPVRPPTGNSDK